MDEISAASKACSSFGTHDSAADIFKGAGKRSFLDRRQRIMFGNGISIALRKIEDAGERQNGFAGVVGLRELVGNDGTTNDVTKGTSAVSNKNRSEAGIVRLAFGPRAGTDCSRHLRPFPHAGFEIPPVTLSLACAAGPAAAPEDGLGVTAWHAAGGRSPSHGPHSPRPGRAVGWHSSESFKRHLDNYRCWAAGGGGTSRRAC
jgi:hypothetical protein